MAPKLRTTFHWLFLALLLSSHLAATHSASAAEALPDIAQATAGADHYAGFFDFYYQPVDGSVLLAIDNWDQDFLYANALATGVGSNDIGLDRGQLGGGRVVRFERHANKVFLKQKNLQYRAASNNPAERLAVEEAFAESILWGFTVTAASDDRVLIDLTNFLLSDSQGVADTLARLEQGSFSLDLSRSALYLPRIKNFPLNSEFEAQLTFNSNRPGAFVRSVTPTAENLTVRVHHSFVQLPEPGYQPRRFHPQSGLWSRSFEDFAASINASMTQRFISRHHLQKQNPDAQRSAAVEPIIYYLDAGVPEPVRSALLDGARWWNSAFEALGFDNAFQVEVLPDGVDPMDIRYNIIQWVHRSTRGWSYGSSITDPRTGEIIKGKVTLGSLRVRQDYRIALALVGLAREGADESIQQLALSRIRQLAAHEVGHTLGIAHNFAASVNQRASVMDYPHPLINIDDQGVLNAVDAYDVGLGAWDYQVIKYGYSEYESAEAERAGLANTLQENSDAGLHFISDADSRAPGSAHPLAHLWDNGASAVDELKHLLNVRKTALARFGASNLTIGQPFAELEEILVPLYFLHRYQTEAVHRLLGGTFYDYAVYNGDPDSGAVVTPVSDADQRQALTALLQSIDPEILAIPDSVLEMIPPKPIGYSRSRESFPLRTAQGIDYATIAETAADHVISGILQPQRLARLNIWHGTDPNLPSVHEVAQQLLQQSFYSDQKNGAIGTIQRTTNHVLLYRLMNLLRSEDTDNQVKAQISLAVHELQQWLQQVQTQSLEPAWQANYQLALDEISLWFNNHNMESLLSEPLPMPPGAPI